MRRVVLWFAAALTVAIGLAFVFLGDPELPREILLAKYGRPPSRFTTLPSGATAHYRDQGNANGTALLLLHGSNASLHTWEPWVKILGNESRIVTVDLPGHGLTIAKSGETFTTESMAGFIGEFTAAIGLNKFAVGGNSMGGRVAGRVAMLFPQKTTKLILIDSSGVLPPDLPPVPAIFWMARTPVLREFLRLLPARPICERMLKASFFNHALITPEMVDRYWELNRSHEARAANRARFSMSLAYFQSESQFFRNNAGKITVPTLILWGRRDRLLPVSAAEILKAAIPGGRVIVYERAGHILMEDAAESSARDVGTFLRE
jgi:pimeloyl-ACP methyl ester carboxylesterase